jgi:alpha-galactosidase
MGKNISWSLLLFLVAVSCKTAPKKAVIPDAPAFYALAETPPMGWNSWDCFGETITESEVRANADYMAEHLKQHGWEYVVVDIRWYFEKLKNVPANQTDTIVCMDEFGRLIPAPGRFPSAANGKGFRPLADYIHSKGLKFGIHIMRGIAVDAVKKNTPVKGTKYFAKDIFSKDTLCAWFGDMFSVVANKPGAQEYYNSLFDLYASWGVDFVKVDDLSFPYHKGEIELICKAIDQCGRLMVFSTSPGATPLESANHIKQNANMWRICDDFWDNWSYLLPMFELCRNWAPHSGPGHWADADMLPLGKISLRGEWGEPRNSNFTKDEQYTLINLWSMFRSPLIFGGDLPQNDDFTNSLITNDEVIAVNQCSLNNKELKNSGGLVVWVADVPDSSDKYVAFFNSNNEGNASISASLAELGLSGNYIAKNLWTKESFELKDGILLKEIAPHASAIFRLIKN